MTSVRVPIAVELRDDYKLVIVADQEVCAIFIFKKISLTNQLAAYATTPNHRELLSMPGNNCQVYVEKTPKITPPSFVPTAHNITALLVQSRGGFATTACEKCSKNQGIFLRCIKVQGKYSSFIICTNFF